jgi:hypothetical protein
LDPADEPIALGVAKKASSELTPKVSLNRLMDDMPLFDIMIYNVGPPR